MRRFRALVVGLLAGSLLLVALPALSAPTERPLYAIVVGYNGVSDALRKRDGTLTTLRYADDDAARFYSLVSRASRHAVLLSVIDAATQRWFPRAAAEALPPTLAELTRALSSMQGAMARDRSAGREPVLIFFFSGHGVRMDTGEAALSLLDAPLTRKWLQDELIARTPARFIHLVIDACHAEALVQARDVEATLEPLDPAERDKYLDAGTLARSPNVGVVLASTAGAQSFEWDEYRAGVFAHELLSGLRGAADVNRDGHIEYSEIAAFLAAANLLVRDPRARLDLVVRPPAQDRRAPLFDIGRVTGQFALVGRADGAWADGFFVETESGARVVDVFPEKGTELVLRLPARERLFVVRRDAEAEISAAEGARVDFRSLKARPPRVRARSAIASALHDGLFATRFGPSFYRGYVSQREEFVPVWLARTGDDASGDQGSDAGLSTRRAVGLGLLAGGGAAVVATGVFSALALDARADYNATDLEKPAHDAEQRFERYRSLAWVSGGTAAALMVASATLLLWPEEPASTGSAMVRFQLVAGGAGVAASGSF